MLSPNHLLIYIGHCRLIISINESQNPYQSFMHFEKVSYIFPKFQTSGVDDRISSRTSLAFAFFAFPHLEFYHDSHMSLQAVLYLTTLSKDIKLVANCVTPALTISQPLVKFFIQFTALLHFICSWRSSLLPL